jgi:uncharacterized RDD family membrane protein YckC/Tfp pilus assembly major pilin PilA
VYAEFWRRLFAYVIDYFVLSLAIVFVLIPVALSDEPPWAAMFIVAAYVGVPWLYYAISEASSWQATVGKLATGIKVTDYQGHRISFGRATGRFFGKLVSSLTLLIGYVMAGFTARRQALHDMMAGTLVVRRNLDSSTIAQAPPGGPVSGLAIAFMILVAIIPVIGILAAIAIPAYQDYTIRAQVAEGLSIASDYKAAVAEAVANGIAFDDISSEAFELPTSSEGRYVASIDVVSGAIAITYGKDANPRLDSRTLTLVPAVDANGDLVWNCGYARSKKGVTDIFDEHWQYTDIDEKYLPAACRARYERE